VRRYRQRPATSAQVQPGHRFGSWTVISRPEAPTQPGRPLRVRVRCDCGFESLVVPYDLIHHQSTRCRDCAQAARFGRLAKDRIKIGDTFGRWQVTAGPLTVPDRPGRHFRIRCRCGTRSLAKGFHLLAGKTTQCSRCAASKRNRKHGETDSLTWKSWQAMLQRCSWPNHRFWRRYGGRGIRVCPRWRTYENFRQDMGRRPGLAWSLERIDNDGNYEPSNCRWIRKVLQASNRSNTVRLTIQGVQRTLGEWAEHSGICAATIRTRLGLGWDPPLAVFSPVRRVRDSAGRYIRRGDPRQLSLDLEPAAPCNRTQLLPNGARVRRAPARPSRHRQSGA
jgi:hypothetical protein